MSTTLNQIFSLATRTLAVVDHPMLKRANLGFQLNQPFAWSLINTAAVMARMMDEEGYCAEQLESQHIRDEIVTSEMNIERLDQLIVKMATLRNFNRKVCGSNDIGMGTINACLKPDESAVNLEDIKIAARERITIERLHGKLKGSDVKVRFTQLVTGMYDIEMAKKRQTKRLMDEVFFLCNRHDDMLFAGNYEQQLEAHVAYADVELADYDGFEHLGDALAEKCVTPIIRARDEIRALMDKSYRSSVQSDGSKLLAEIDKLAVELGINFAKLDAEKAKINAELVAAEAEDAAIEAEIDAELYTMNIPGLDVDPPAVAAREFRTIKSEARLKREAEETEAAAQRAEYAAANATKAAKAKATREAKQRQAV